MIHPLLSLSAYYLLHVYFPLRGTVVLAQNYYFYEYC